MTAGDYGQPVSVVRHFVHYVERKEEKTCLLDPGSYGIRSPYVHARWGSHCSGCTNKVKKTILEQ